MRLRVPVRQTAGLLALCVMLSLLGSLAAGAPQERRPQIRIEGRAREVRSEGRLFVVDTGRERYDVEYPRGGAGFGFNVANMREGDRVRVEGILTGTRLIEARRVVILNQSGDRDLGSGEITGRVTDVDRSRRRFSVRRDGGGTVRVAYDSGTSVRGLDRNDATRIRDGDSVRVEGRWETRELLTARRIDVRGGSDRDGDWRSGDQGRIEFIGPRRREMRTRFGRTTWLVDVQRAEFRAGGRRISVDDLRDGDPVRIYGEVRDGKIRATRVELTDFGRDRSFGRGGGAGRE
jgi:hypothetical protein